MRKFVATLLLLLAFASSSSAQVVISKENRVLNRKPGYCAWTCLETLGRHHKIEPLYNLLDKRAKEFTWDWNGEKWVQSPYLWVDYGSYKLWMHRAPGPHQALVNKLNELKVKYHYQNYGNYDKTMLKEAVRDKKGCMVVVKWWLDGEGKPMAPSGEDTHAIIILNYTDDNIEFYDPNDKNTTYTATLRWFNQYWTGYILVIDK